MKRSSIILLAVVAILIGALLVTLQDASVYATFTMAKKQQPETVTVVAVLDVEKPMDFQAESSLLTFTALDKEGVASTVIYNQPKPTDFERSEEIGSVHFVSCKRGLIGSDVCWNVITGEDDGSLRLPDENAQLFVKTIVAWENRIDFVNKDE